MNELVCVFVRLRSSNYVLFFFSFPATLWIVMYPGICFFLSSFGGVNIPSFSCILPSFPFSLLLAAMLQGLSPPHIQASVCLSCVFVAVQDRQTHYKLNVFSRRVQDRQREHVCWFSPHKQMNVVTKGSCSSMRHWSFSTRPEGEATLLLPQVLLPFPGNLG